MAMQWCAWVVSLATAASVLVGSDASVAALTQVRMDPSLQIPAPVFLQASESASSTTMADAFLRGNGPVMSQIVKRADKMDVSEALKRLEGKIPHEVPPEVVAFVQTNKKASLDDDSIAKANKIVRDFIEEGWKKLDAKLLECKVFQDRNRGTYDQVMTDLSRLAEQIADLERQRSEANEMINTLEIQFTVIQTELRKQTIIYMQIRWANSQEMIIRKNDLAVFLFILRFTECKEGTQEVKKQTMLAQLGGTHGTQQCDCGPVPMFNFNDPEMQDQLNKMSPKARESVKAALSGEAMPTLSLLQSGSSTGVVQDPPPPPASDRSPVQERMTLKDMAKKCPCVRRKYCPKFHDKVSLLWGKYQDMVDELQAEMDRNSEKFEVLRKNFILQLDANRVAKGRYIMLLDEVVSNLNADQSQQEAKQEERTELDAEYYKYMAKCRKDIEDIICDGIVAWLCIRNAIMAESTVTEKGKLMIQDCEITYWVPGDCSMECDDDCPTIMKVGHSFNPYNCGGWQTLTRHVVTAVPEKWKDYAVRCPLDRNDTMITQRKCNQNRCPVNCEMSMWSAWSKCTKECEGGVRSRTRSILTKPKNGGESCNTVQESAPCNTGSCDRDCDLADWSEWGFCTMACTVSGPAGALGLQERVRKVVRPTRGEGKCPKDESPARLEDRRCNTFDCVSPLQCISKQDLIIAVDSSGSMEDFGFNVVKDFIHQLIDKYLPKYYGQDAMQIGVVEFGNGQVAKDGTIASAIEVVKLTNDMTEVKKQVKLMKWQGGFTNMAQALVLSQAMLKAGQRHKAQSAVLVVTDGKPSTLFETNEQVVKMKDAAIKLFFAPITSEGGASIQLMKHWASQPWESHFVHVPGVYALKGSTTAFTDRFIATFCPEAFNPSATMKEEKELGFFLLKEHAICGDPTLGNRLSTNLNNVGECAALARAAKCGTGTNAKPCEAFSYGEWYRKGYCYSEHFTINEAKIKEWQLNRANPDAPCDGGSAAAATGSSTTNTDWTYNPFYDTYVLETDTMSGGDSSSSTTSSTTR